MPKNTTDSADQSADCLLAFAIVTSLYGQLARSLFMLLQIIQIVAFFFLLAEFRRRRKMPMHGNLKLLYVHLIVVYQLAPVGYPMAEVRNIVLSIFYAKCQCQMMTPLWYILISRGLILAYTYAIPFLHFAIMLERFRATIKAESYELKGNSFGLVALSLIYILATAMTASILWLFLYDNSFNLHQKLPFNTALSKSNSELAQFFTTFQTLLILFTIVGDFYVYKMNKRLRRERIILNYAASSQKITCSYNLSRNYQLHENYTAMRLILPLDVTYMLFILLFNILVMILRGGQAGMSLATFLAHYNMLSCLLSLYTIISLFIYRHFLLNIGTNGRRAKNAHGNNNAVMPMERIGQVYFEQLKQQWDRQKSDN